MSELRTVEQRKKDVLAALERNGHMWLATAGDGMPHVIAVSAWWSGVHLVVATMGTSRTAANLQPGAWARLVAGTPDDAVVILGRVAESRPAAEAGDMVDGFAAAMGWDPREVGEGWVLFRIEPARIQAFRGYDEVEGRDVMRRSRWLA